MWRPARDLFVLNLNRKEHEGHEENPRACLKASHDELDNKEGPLVNLFVILVLFAVF
jgi:hypothetical protein